MDRESFLRTSVLALLAAILLAPAAARAAGVKALFDLSAPVAGPFPSNRFMVKDEDQITRRRVKLPLPDCAVFPSDCEELAIVNTLDGFNLQPRLSVPFSGAIDPKTVTNAAMFLVRLGDADRNLRNRDDDDERENERRPAPDVVGINQVVWDPASNTLHAESDQLLRQHTRYLLVITNGIRDTAGRPVEAGDFARFQRDDHFGQARDRVLKDYREELLEGLEALEQLGVRTRSVVAASVFTTQSVTAALERIRDEIKAATPAPARFDILSGTNRRALFLTSDMSLERKAKVDENAVVFSQEVQTGNGPDAFVKAIVPADALNIVSGAVRWMAFGKYLSPEYENPEQYIPAVGTRTGMPKPLGTNQIYFNLLVPTAPKPPRGWPIAIFGHGLASNKQAGTFTVAARLASHGMATIAINAVGHGLGPRGTLIVRTRTEGAFTFSAGGRGIDQNGDGSINTDEGIAAAPSHRIISNRDGYRQTVVDHMQLVRIIEMGLDVDGDGVADFDPSRIYYVGQSQGGIVGTIFMAVEPGVLAGALNVPGGPIIAVARLNPGLGLRSRVTAFLSSRTPTLLNALPSVPPLVGFNENMPLRNQPAVINTVPGAMALQEVFDRHEWVNGAGDPVAYAPHLRQRPLDGMPAKDVIIQFARGDLTVPNPTTTALVRAGNLADRTTFYRYDLVFPTLPAGSPKNPHNFMPNFTVPATFAQRDAAQTQIAQFFATNGEDTIDPDGAGPFFETPIAGPLPEDVGAIP
jgi:hypothetical protein